MTRIDEHIIIKKASNMFNSVNKKTPKMNKGQRKEKTILEPTRKKSNKITEISKYFIIILNVNCPNCPINRPRLTGYIKNSCYVVEADLELTM
jgi:hypothetical protein